MVHARWPPVTPLMMVAVVRFASPPQTGRTLDDTIRPFLAQHCFNCHNSRLNTGGLNLEAFATKESLTLTQDRERWELLLQKLQSGEMPPEGLPRPSEPDLKATTQFIRDQLDRADAQAKPIAGRVTALLVQQHARRRTAVRR
jgi:mono/diheme cytochrome c family protein